MTEFQFRVNEVKYPIFLKGETEADALSQLKLIGYTLNTEPLTPIEVAARIHDKNITTEEAPPSIKESITQSISKEKKSTVNVKQTTTCDCCDNEQDPLVELNYFGRVLLLCDTCYAKEKPTTTRQLDTTYGNNLQDKIEKIVAKTVNVSQERWQELYNEERPAWIISNFESMMDMRDKLVSFIVELEQMQFATKAKMRVAYDASRELEAKLTRQQREALVFDPNFKVPENSQHNKIRMTKEERSKASLTAMGMSEKQIAEFLEGLK